MTLWREWPDTSVGMGDHVSRDVVIGNDIRIDQQAMILPGTVAAKRSDAGVIDRFLIVRRWDWPDRILARHLSRIARNGAEGFFAAIEGNDEVQDLPRA